MNDSSARIDPIEAAICRRPRPVPRLQQAGRGLRLRPPGVAPGRRRRARGSRCSTVAPDSGNGTAGVSPVPRGFWRRGRGETKGSASFRMQSPSDQFTPAACHRRPGTATPVWVVLQARFIGNAVHHWSSMSSASSPKRFMISSRRPKARNTPSRIASRSASSTCGDGVTYPPRRFTWLSRCRETV